MRLKLRYSPIADNGVEIEMLFHHRRAWTAYVERLGTAHSAYSHSVECGLDNGALYIKSIGSAGDVYERRNPQTGQLLHRLVAPKSIEDNR